MKNKIGLITIHDTLNYGSLVQAFSLYKAIETLGMSVELIDYKCEAIANREKTYPLKECLSIKGIYNYLTKHKSFSKRYNNMWDFMKKNMLVSRAYDKSTISQSNKDYDTFVVGSDIVWGMPVTGHDFTYMLDFVEDAKKKVAFSPSIGTPWNEDEKEHIKKLLNRFDFISTREELGAEWVEELTHKPVEVSCDPTMLWDRNFWGELADDKIVPERPYVLVYMTTTDKKNIKDAISYGKEHNMPVYYLNFNRPVKGLHNISPMTVGEWIALFKNSKRVSEEVKKPKALGDIRGVSYIYPILWRFGLIRVPEAIEKKMGKQR